MIRSMLSLTAIATLTGVAAAAQDFAPSMHDALVESVAVDSVKGTVGSIDRENKSFTLEVGERTQTVKIDESTTFYLDGKASTREQVLKVGAEVTVTHAGGTASRIEGTSEESALALDTVKGTVASIDRESKSFTLKVGERTQTVKTDDKTTYYLDGRASTREQVLKVGAEITVTHTEGTASRIDAMSEEA
jgi:hypothetical protein